MWYKINNDQVELRILAKPNAKKTAIVDISELGLHIALHAKPHKNEANKELINYLAKLLCVPKSQVRLQRGEKSRHKQVIVPLTITIQQFIEDPTQFML